MEYCSATVTPDGLVHYGRKGMKWGQHIFGKDRSSNITLPEGARRTFDFTVPEAKKVARRAHSGNASAKQSLSRLISEAEALEPKMIKASKAARMLEDAVGFDKNGPTMEYATMRAEARRASLLDKNSRGRLGELDIRQKITPSSELRRLKKMKSEAMSLYDGDANADLNKMSERLRDIDHDMHVIMTQLGSKSHPHYYNSDEYVKR